MKPIIDFSNSKNALSDRLRLVKEDFLSYAIRSNSFLGPGIFAGFFRLNAGNRLTLAIFRRYHPERYTLVTPSKSDVNEANGWLE